MWRRADRSGRWFRTNHELGVTIDCSPGLRRCETYSAAFGDIIAHNVSKPRAMTRIVRTARGSSDATHASLRTYCAPRRSWTLVAGAKPQVRRPSLVEPRGLEPLTPCMPSRLRAR